MIEVWQIMLNDDLVDAINEHGWNYNEKSQTYARVIMGYEFSNWKNDMARHYTKVYEVLTDNLEEAFSLTNVWNDESRVKRIEQGTSGSVGNLFMKFDGANRRMFFCDNFGFTEIL
jgi:hypothetical protein